jgi:hypothetical protein
MLLARVTVYLDLRATIQGSSFPRACGGNPVALIFCGVCRKAKDTGFPPEARGNDGGGNVACELSL